MNCSDSQLLLLVVERIEPSRPLKSGMKARFQRRRFGLCRWLAQRSGYATIRRPTGFQGFKRCETVLQNRLDWRYLYAILTGYARVFPEAQGTALKSPQGRAYPWKGPTVGDAGPVTPTSVDGEILNLGLR